MTFQFFFVGGNSKCQKKIAGLHKNFICLQIFFNFVFFFKNYFQSGCGLLVSVIKTLDASETNAERDLEKNKIEKEYKKSDQKLNQLVSKHDNDLTQVMQLFSKVSTQVSSSKEKIHAVKEKLYACKKLLSCRSDELKRLWVNAVQQKYVFEMLEQM